VSEVLFFHLERASLEDTLPVMLERTRERDQKRAVVRIGTPERMETLDAHLWTYSEQTFLAHGTAAEGHKSRQPIYLTTENDNPNQAQVLFLVDGAVPAPASRPAAEHHAPPVEVEPDEVEPDIQRRLDAILGGGMPPVESLPPDKQAALKRLQEYERKVTKVNAKYQEEFFEPVEEQIEKELYAREVK